MKKVLMLTTGGTIASKRTSEGLEPLISGEELLRDLPLLLRGGAEPLQETGALRGFGKILYFTASPDPVWRSLTAGAEPVLLLCGVPEQPDVRCICYTKENYAAVLQQLEL